MNGLDLRPWTLLLALGGAQAGEPVIGGPCEGCEAVFQGQPAELDARARIAPPGQAGEPMVLEGRVLDRDARPRAGVVVYAYHTDAEGVYPGRGRGGDAAARHGALRGWARSDAEGRYRFDTIRPASYPGRTVPAHVHLHVIEPGCATYWIDDVVFTDDPLLTAAQRRAHEHGRGGPGIATPKRRAGVWQVNRDIHLGAGIADYACDGAS